MNLPAALSPATWVAIVGAALGIWLLAAIALLTGRAYAALSRKPPFIEKGSK